MAKGNPTQTRASTATATPSLIVILEFSGYEELVTRAPNAAPLQCALNTSPMVALTLDRLPAVWADVALPERHEEAR